MGYELIFTEKPSAAKKIAEALADTSPKKENLKGVPYYRLKHKGKEIVVGCAVGHLYTVSEKKKSFTYPSFDVEWSPTSEQKKKEDYSKKYLTALKSLAKDATEFTVACDYDIEGEVIGLNLVRYVAKKKDASRMKFSTLTKPDLIESYENKQNTLDWGQAKAGESRHMIDWFYGINLSRALTLSIKKANMYKTLSIGRVQGPALKILVDRELEIRKFVPQKFWQLELNGDVKGNPMVAWHEKDKFWDQAECDAALARTKGKDGMIKSVERNQFNQAPPTPFDLTTLQTESYRVFHISPKDTLALAQELYINGYISYPRTSSQQLSPKLGFHKIIANLARQPEYTKLTAMLLDKKTLTPNNGKKTDPAHPAIYPTGEVPKELKPRERKLYDLIVKRFLATFADPARRETMKVRIDVNTEMFISEGTRTVVKGWHVLYEPYARMKEEELPEVHDKDTVKVKKIDKHEKETQPPKRYTPASIIKELEKRNLGTKSTRAQIIESLEARGYVGGKSLEATELGIKTLEALEKHTPEILNEEFTRSLEGEMEEIREGKTEPAKVIEDAKKDLTKILKSFKEKEKDIGMSLRESYHETLNDESRIGKCPHCKEGELHIRTNRQKQRFIACNAYPGCKTTFSVPQAGKLAAIDKKCEGCGFPMIQISSGKIPQVVCFNKACKLKAVDDKGLKKEVADIKNGTVEKKCPKCNEGNLVLRNSVYGQFFGCSKFPKCRFTQNLAPLPKKDEQGTADAAPAQAKGKA